MMKTMLLNVQTIALQNGSINDNGQTNGTSASKSNLNLPQAANSPGGPAAPQATDLGMEELNETRLRETCHKAISGSLLLLLKWFKTSHILKFEYLTQLLLDSNYIPLVLKYFAHQNVEDLVAIKYDRHDLGFFHHCRVDSDHPPLSPSSPAAESSPSSSPDEAVPPPIPRRHLSPPRFARDQDGIVTSPANLDDPLSSNQNGQFLRPSVDELGNPLAPIPQTPISTFSFRQFQTSIHLLRVLQKITRSKAHRILLLVQYKSSQILRRILRVPDPTLRLYVLKLFKSQVPYCGRKWRQGNMKVITAIYLHCRPELRDDWLAGMHDQSVEGEVDDALPLEWALRGLTFWWTKRLYADVVKDASTAGDGIEDGEKDFFQRELDRMGWGVAAMGTGNADNDIEGGGDAAGSGEDAAEEAPLGSLVSPAAGCGPTIRNDGNTGTMSAGEGENEERRQQHQQQQQKRDQDGGPLQLEGL
jgi:hypothetical protein